MNQTQRLVDNYLREHGHGGLAEYLTDKRDEGASYERIAKDLYELSKGIVDVTWQTVSRWCDGFGIKEKAS